jgi:hypothetical protein
MIFKKGDLVLCINSMNFNFINRDAFYVVKNVSIYTYKAIVIENVQNKVGYPNCCFIPATKNTARFYGKIL